LSQNRRQSRLHGSRLLLRQRALSLSGHVNSKPKSVGYILPGGYVTEAGLNS